MNDKRPAISFDNTQYAFAYKNNTSLRKAKLLFTSMAYPWMVKLGTRLTPWAMNMGLPINGLIRGTIFGQFVGGETLAQTSPVVEQLKKFNVRVILDYGVEGKEGEINFDQACEAFIKVIEYAATGDNIPFMSIKVTGLARFGLLEKLDKAAGPAAAVEGRVLVESLSAEEKKEWERVCLRMDSIMAIAAKNQIGVLVDAEETWIQDPVDALTMQMMEKYNREKAVVFNTVQLYRHDRLQFLKDSFTQAAEKGFILGVKLVRGAYMEKERKRAMEMKYASPIQPDKEASDRDYNAALAFCIDHLEKVYLIIASHNEASSLLATQLLQQKGLAWNHPHIHFSQLFGMSDNITFNLAKAGCSVSKYLPFGPIKDVIPYLMRRAQENSSVRGHTGRELGLINKEMKRRRSEH